MKGDIVASLVGMIAGIGVVTASFALHVGTLTKPQPGFFPLLGGGALVVLSSTLLVQAWQGRSTGTEAFDDLRRPGIVMAGLGVYVMTLDRAGYVLATTLIAGILLRVLGVTSWRALVAASIALSAGTYLLFARVLGVELPAGLLDFLS